MLGNANRNPGLFSFITFHSPLNNTLNMINAMNVINTMSTNKAMSVPN